LTKKPTKDRPLETLPLLCPERLRLFHRGGINFTLAIHQLYIREPLIIQGLGVGC
jgi:hypothetical protein